MLKVFWAHVRANAWCLFHFGDNIITTGIWDIDGRYVTTSVVVGRGSIKTWKTRKVFYYEC